MEGVILPPDLAEFAAEAVASGKYRDTAEVVRTGIDLLRHRDDARTAFIASLHLAQRESEAEGFHQLDDVLSELDTIIIAEARNPD